MSKGGLQFDSRSAQRIARAVRTVERMPHNLVGRNRRRPRGGGGGGAWFWAKLNDFHSGTPYKYGWIEQEFDYDTVAWSDKDEGRSGTVDEDYAVQGSKIGGLPADLIVAICPAGGGYVFFEQVAWIGAIIECDDGSGTATVDAGYSGKYPTIYNQLYPWHRPGDTVLVAPFVFGSRSGCCGEIVVKVEGMGLWTPPVVGSPTYDTSDDAASVQDQPAALDCEGN